VPKIKPLRSAPIIGLSPDPQTKYPQLPVQPSLHAHSLTTRLPSSARQQSHSPNQAAESGPYQAQRVPSAQRAVADPVARSPTRLTPALGRCIPYRGCAHACSPLCYHHPVCACATRQSPACSRAITPSRLRLLKVGLRITTFRSCLTPRLPLPLRPPAVLTRS
jgi:hypothetical protein